MKDSLNSLSQDEIRQINDGLVVESVLRGDREAFEVFVRKYEIALMILAKRKLGDEELAKEAVQETFLSALRSLKTYNSRFAFRTWLWSILINRCRQIGIRNRKRGKVVAIFSDAVDTAGMSGREQDPSVDAIKRESANRLSVFIDQLPRAQAEAIRLRFFDGLKFQEIADQMQSSLSAAKQRVRNGLQAISQKMTDSGARAGALPTEKTNYETNE